MTNRVVLSLNLCIERRRHQIHVFAKNKFWVTVRCHNLHSSSLGMVWLGKGYFRNCVMHCSAWRLVSSKKKQVKILSKFTFNFPIKHCDKIEKLKIIWNLLFDVCLRSLSEVKVNKSGTKTVNWEFLKDTTINDYSTDISVFTLPKRSGAWIG